MPTCDLGAETPVHALAYGRRRPSALRRSTVRRGSALLGREHPGVDDLGLAAAVNPQQLAVLPLCLPTANRLRVRSRQTEEPASVHSLALCPAHSVTYPCLTRSLPLVQREFTPALSQCSETGVGLRLWLTGTDATVKPFVPANSVPLARPSAGLCRTPPSSMLVYSSSATRWLSWAPCRRAAPLPSVSARCCGPLPRCSCPRTCHCACSTSPRRPTRPTSRLAILERNGDQTT